MLTVARRGCRTKGRRNALREPAWLEVPVSRPAERVKPMETQLPDRRSVAERENKILIATAVGLGCLILLCLVIVGVAVVMALVWTAEGTLGPSGLAPLVRLA